MKRTTLEFRYENPGENPLDPRGYLSLDRI